MEKKWFHCGKCGKLFSHTFDAGETLLCEHCGSIPQNELYEPKAIEQRRRSEFSKPIKQDGILFEVGRRSRHKKRGKNLIVRIVAVWVVILILFLWGRMHVDRVNDISGSNNSMSINLAEGTFADEKVAILRKSLPECHRSLNGFLSSVSPEISAQFVAYPIEMAGKIAAFYRENPFPRIGVKGLKRIAAEPIQVGDEWFIETRWSNDEGASFDAIFIRQGSSWKLDWPHFSRYNNFSWPLFLAGDGPDTGEFRLLVRLSGEADELERGGSRSRLTFLSPVFARPDQTGFESPIFVINRRSEEGLLIIAALQSSAEQKPIFGKKLQPMEPQNVARVRVSIKRENIAGELRFSIDKILACHWLSSDYVGFNPEELGEVIIRMENQ